MPRSQSITACILLYSTSTALETRSPEATFLRSALWKEASLHSTCPAAVFTKHYCTSLIDGSVTAGLIDLTNRRADVGKLELACRENLRRCSVGKVWHGKHAVKRYFSSCSVKTRLPLAASSVLQAPSIPNQPSAIAFVTSIKQHLLHPSLANVPLAAPRVLSSERRRRALQGLEVRTVACPEPVRSSATCERQARVAYGSVNFTGTGKSSIAERIGQQGAFWRPLVSSTAQESMGATCSPDAPCPDGARARRARCHHSPRTVRLASCRAQIRLMLARLRRHANPPQAARRSTIA
eukprot:IDg16860t1